MRLPPIQERGPRASKTVFGHSHQTNRSLEVGEMSHRVGTSDAKSVAIERLRVFEVT